METGKVCSNDVRLGTYALTRFMDVRDEAQSGYIEVVMEEEGKARTNQI